MTYRANEMTTAATGDAGSIVEAAPASCIPTIPRNVHGAHWRKGRVRARDGGRLADFTGRCFRSNPG
jgi:hypothetical protein